MPDVLTPDEIAALTEAYAQEPPAPGRLEAGAVRAVDLANQERSLEGRLPGLDLVLGRFARGVRNALAGCFGDVPSVRTASVGLVRFARLAPVLTDPAVLVRFRLTPLRGQALLAIPRSLVAAMLQVACGGASGQTAAVPAREPSPVELRLIERLAGQLLAELRDAWRPVAALECGLVQVDATPLVAAVAAPDELVVHAELAVVAAGVAPSAIALVVPNGALDAVRSRLDDVRRLDDGGPAPDASWVEALGAGLLDVPVELAAEMGTARLTLGRVMALAVGDVVTFDVGPDGPAVVRVAGTPRFLGTPQVQHGTHAVRITARL